MRVPAPRTRTREKTKGRILVVSDEFIAICDQIILAETDPEVLDGIRQIDEQSLKIGIGFYEYWAMLVRKSVVEKLRIRRKV